MYEHGWAKNKRNFAKRKRDTWKPLEVSWNSLDIQLVSIIGYDVLLFERRCPNSKNMDRWFNHQRSHQGLGSDPVAVENPGLGASWGWSVWSVESHIPMAEVVKDLGVWHPSLLVLRDYFDWCMKWKHFLNATSIAGYMYRDTVALAWIASFFHLIAIFLAARRMVWMLIKSWLNTCHRCGTKTSWQGIVKGVQKFT